MSSDCVRVLDRGNAGRGPVGGGLAVRGRVEVMVADAISRAQAPEVLSCLHAAARVRTPYPPALRLLPREARRVVAIAVAVAVAVAVAGAVAVAAVGGHVCCCHAAGDAAQQVVAAVVSSPSSQSSSSSKSVWGRGLRPASRPVRWLSKLADYGRGRGYIIRRSTRPTVSN